MIRNHAASSAWLAIPVAMITLAWTATMSAVASTAGHFSNSEPCPSVSANLHLGTATPVLLVHGFNEGPAVFTREGSPTLDKAISSAIPGAVKVVTFDYSKWSRLWVTFTLIGPQLAKCITWLAHISALQNGPGKVIIVAHSMGGLAVRCAVDPGCAKGTQAVDPSLIALVITLGTPNTGSQPQSLGPVLDTVCASLSWCNDWLILRDSPAAQAMSPGSADLAKLAFLPGIVPVDALAGQITVTTNLFGAKYVLKDLGDVIVPISSALADAKQGALHDGPGANKITVNCGTVSVTQLPGWIKASASKLAPAAPATCWHLTETTARTWQADIIAAIKDALAGAPSGACHTPAPAPPGTAYVVGHLSNGSGTVTPVDLAAGTAGTPIPVGSNAGPIAIAPDGKTAYVTSVFDGLTPINLATGTASAPIPVAGGALGIAITPDGKTAYVTTYSGPGVTPVSLPADSPGTPIATKYGQFLAIAITPDGKTAYVGSQYGHMVIPINLATAAPGPPIPVGGSPRAIAITPDGKTAYVAGGPADVGGGGSYLTAITVATNTARKPIPLAGLPQAIAITPDCKTAYVILISGTATLTPVSLPAGTVGIPIPLTSGSYQMALSPDGKTAYVTNYSGTVTPVSLPAGTLGTPIRAGRGSEAIALASAG